MTKETKALIAAFLGNAIFGFSFLFSSLALEVVTPFTLLACRFLIAFIIMTIMIVTGIKKVHFKGKCVWKLLILGGIHPVAYFLFESYGIQLTNSSFSGTMISLATIATFIIGAVMLKEKFSIDQLLWAFCSVAGVALISLFGGNDGRISLIGVLLLIGAVLATSMFNVLSRKWASEFSPFERTYIMFAMGSAAFLIGALIETDGGFFDLLPQFFGNTQFLISVIYLACISSIVAFLLINYSVSHIEARRTSIFTCMTTVISILAGIIILRERFTVLRALGSALILLGVYKVSIEKN